MDISQHLSHYDRRDYFASELAAAGWWSEAEQLWLIVPCTEVEEISDTEGQPLNFLQVGRPGVDGIAFGYRSGEAGFWAYHPIEGDFQLVAPTVQDFLKGWNAGEISV